MNGHKRTIVRQTWRLAVWTICIVPLSTIVTAAEVSNPEVAAQSGPQGSEPDNGGPDVAGRLKEIVVSAQRRNQNVENVPIAMAVVSRGQIEQLDLRTADDIQLVSPGLDFHSGYSYLQTFIRGVGFPFATAGLEPSVAIYIDGAYVPRGGGTTFDMLDISDVQVLKGPQGTLYGQNATGGAILITTADPVNTREGHFSLEYGRFNHGLGEFVVNTPISDTVSVRFAGRYTTQDGYVHNVYDDKDLGGREGGDFRAKVAYRPNSNLTAVLGFEYDHAETHGVPVEETLAAPLCLGCAVKPGSGPSPGFYQTNLDFTPPVYDNDTAATFKITDTTGVLTVQSVTAYRHILENNPSDQDFTSATLFSYYNYNGGRTISEDLTASTNSQSWIDGVAGLSYFEDSGFFNLKVDGGAFQPVIDATGQIPYLGNTVQTHSAAAFAEATVRPVDRLSFILGGRYTYDDRNLNGTPNLAGNVAFGGTPGMIDFGQSAAFSRFTPRVVGSYDAGPVNVYASFNEGFKAGGFNTPTALPRPIVRSESIKSYEVGAKYESADHRLRANGDVFYYTHDNMQVSVIDVSTGATNTTNAARANGKGVDLDAQYAATDWLDVMGGASFLRARFLSYPDASLAGPGYGPTGQVTGLVAVTENLSDTTVPHAPAWSGFVAANVRAPLVNNWTGHLSAVVRYSSSYDFVAGAGGPLGLDRQNATTIVNMSAYAASPADKYELGFYVDNLANQKYVEIRQTSAPFGAVQIVDEPITFGLRLRYNFW